MDVLPVVETFYSLQGEGAHSGWPAYFIRLAGCRNACAFCDTKESWNEKSYPTRPVTQLVQEAVRSGAAACVVTGGEPMMHDLDTLCRAMKSASLQAWAETSGSEPFSGEWDWLCLSPKPGIDVYPEYYRKASELKVVIAQPSDFAFAENQAALVGESCLCYLQAEWSVSREMTDRIVRYILAHPRWKFSLQTHKFIGIS